MSKTDPARMWALNYQLLLSVIASVTPAIADLGLDTKELFLLAEVDAHPHPAGLASVLCMPKPTVTMIVKRMEAAGFLRRAIDPTDLRRHRLTVTPSARKAITRGLALLSDAFGTRLERLSPAERVQLGTLLEKLSASQ
jgi:DNA-binding MarR family transcriptional regulator